MIKAQAAKPSTNLSLLLGGWRAYLARDRTGSQTCAFLSYNQEGT